MRGISHATQQLIDEVYEILKADHPQTLRQVHYQVFSRQKIEYANDEASYRRLSRVLTGARRKYRQWELAGAEGEYIPNESIPSDWIVDELRTGEKVSVWTDAKEYIDTVRASYRRDSWQDQPFYVELWGEKATVLGSLRPIKQRFGVTLRVCRGFGSEVARSSVES